MSLSRMSVRAKIYVLVGVSTVGMLVYGVWSQNTLSVASATGEYSRRIARNRELIADIRLPRSCIVESYITALDMADAVEAGGDPAVLQGYSSQCKEMKSDFDERHAYWLRELPAGQLRDLKTSSGYKSAAKFYEVMLKEFVPACLNGEAGKARSLVQGAIREQYQAHRDAVDQAVALAETENDQDAAELAALIDSRTIWSVVGMVGLLSLMAGLGWFIAREAVSPLLGSANRLQRLSTLDLAEVSNRLRQNAATTSDKATMASGTAELVSSNAQSLASAVQQFEASIKEIAGNASNAASVARQAVDAASTTNATITRLGESSAEIGNVIKVINSIAEQTNLLALNATIEAARAGEAGKGFAVVANEVKELAKETSKATEDIVRRIETIQTDTQEAVDAIGLVSDIISQINESQNAIAGAVEEQTTMTSEISRNIAEVASGSGDIAQSISLVADAAKNATAGADETMHTAANIEDVATEILKLVGETQVATSAASQQKRGKYQLAGS